MGNDILKYYSDLLKKKLKADLPCPQHHKYMCIADAEFTAFSPVYL